MALISDPISAVASAVQSIVERVVPDPTAQIQAKAQLAQMYLNGDLQTLTSQAGVITAEANSSNKLTSSWRPMLMYLFMVIIAFNYIISPIVSYFDPTLPIALPIPPDMWSLIKLGVGGYVMGRSVEKITTPHPVTGVSPLASTVSAISNVFSGG